MSGYQSPPTGALLPIRSFFHGLAPVATTKCRLRRLISPLTPVVRTRPEGPTDLSRGREPPEPGCLRQGAEYAEKRLCFFNGSHPEKLVGAPSRAVEEVRLLSFVKPKGLGFTSPGRSPGNRVRENNQSPEGALQIFPISCSAPSGLGLSLHRSPGTAPRAFEFEPFGLARG